MEVNKKNAEARKNQVGERYMPGLFGDGGESRNSRLLKVLSYGRVL
jgi:hypothetical protein